jgi:hypothetical protein
VQSSQAEGVKHSLFAALLAALFPLAGLAASEAVPKVVSKLVPTNYGTPILHRVSSDGTITPVKMPAGTRWGGGSPDGSEDPILSPDGTRLAFVQRGSIQVRPLEGGKSTVVVSGYLWEMLLITGWSPDGRHLIYFLGPPQADDAPPSKVTESQHYVYDLKTRERRKINLKGSLCGWLPNGQMLLHDGEHRTLSSMPLEPGGKVTVLYKEAAEFGQIELSPDGRQIALSTNKPNDTSSAQLVTLDLASGKVTPLSKPGEWAQYQWPKWSPSGRRMGWLERTGMVEGRPLSVLAVDGKVITKPAELVDYLWLTDTSLVVVGLEALLVVDAGTGKELGRRALPKAAD